MQNFFTAESFAGRVALVTGATRGIGRAVALALADCGAKVIGTATSETGAAQISEALGDKGRGIVLNVTDAEASKAAVEAIVAEFGRIDILVNNAGITRDMLAMRLSDEAWDAVIETNLTAVFRLTRAVLRPMMKQRFGRIINMSSVVGAMGNAGQANYAAAKAGMIGLTKTLARELAGRGVTVNAVAPGFVRTEMTAAMSEDALKQGVSTVPMGRMAEPEEIAEAVCFLAGDRAAYITGTVLSVNGGLYM